MEVFLFIFLAILCFWRYADKTLFATYLPVIVTACFIRFLEQFVIIDWFRIMIVHDGDWLHLWLPIFADVTVWPIAGYLYIQYMPHRRRLRYTAAWVALQVFYLQMLKWLDVFDMKPGWTLILFTPVTVSFYFGLLYAVWRWLYPKAANGRAAT